MNRTRIIENAKAIIEDLSEEDDYSNNIMVRVWRRPNGEQRVEISAGKKYGLSRTYIRLRGDSVKIIRDGNEL